MSEFIGSRISLISKSDIRYVGTLHEINSDNSTVALEQVRSFGTEGRKSNPDEEIAGSDSVYEYIVFRGSDVKDLRIEEPAPKETKPPPQVPDDPAILGSGSRPSTQAEQLHQQPPPLSQGYPQHGPSPPFQQRPPMPYQQYNQFPQQRFQGPQGSPQPGFPGYGGMPYGPPPPPGHFPPGPGFQGQPGPFPHQQPGFPGPGYGGAPPPPHMQGGGGQQPEPAQPPQLQSAAQSSKPTSKANTPAPAAQAERAAAPTPPVESKPDVATALAAPSTNPPMAAQAAAATAKGKITPAVPLAKPAPAPAPAQAPAAIPNAAIPGQAAADAALQYHNATQAATAAVAAAMAKLPPAAGQKPKETTGGVDNLTQKVNEMRVDDRMRKQTGYAAGPNPGYRGGRGGRGRGGHQQTRGLEVPATDFDFESANAKFNKDELTKEATGSGEAGATPTTASENETSTGLNGDAATGDGAADVVIPAAAAYSKGSFFDNISSEARDREDAADARRKPGGPEFRTEERKRNMETFGLGSVDGGYRGRGRGRGRGYRGGYRGGFRGASRGSRGGPPSTGNTAEA